MAFIINGNKDSPPELPEDVLQIVVVGEPKCGKTCFIRAFYNHHYLRDIYSHNGVIVYPCEYWFNNRLRKLAVIEIPSDPDFLEEQRKPHYESADAIIFLYAIDDPLSHEMLTEKWIPEARAIINSHRIQVLVVGTKRDLRDNQQWFELLPEARDQSFEAYMICSANNRMEVNNIFHAIIQDLIHE